MVYLFIGAMICTALIFFAGANWGNIRAHSENIHAELKETERLLNAQGDKPETIEPTLALIR